MDNEFLLMDRIQKIQQVIGKYGEDNFYISFSGGKDSCVMSALFDEALPGNKIPRVYANTGIELNMIVDFVKRERERRAHSNHQAECSNTSNVRGGRLSIQKQISQQESRYVSAERNEQNSKSLSEIRTCKVWELCFRRPCLPKGSEGTI